MSKSSLRAAEIAENDGDRNFVTALARGLDILRCFDQPNIELTASELARRVGLNQSTVWRLCHTLVKCGFLVQDANGPGLHIGAPALTLGYAAIESLAFPAIALPYMRQITALTKGTTALSIRQSIEMISVQHYAGEFVLPNQPVGWRALLTSTASGLAILSALPADEREAAIGQIRQRDPAAWERRAARLAQAQADYAQTGFVASDTMLGGQYAIVAVPLLTTTSGATAAWGLSCGGLASRWDSKELHRAGQELLRIKDLLQPLLAHAK
jgi:DNA-binding IclR family transcriptional regulator